MLLIIYILRRVNDLGVALGGDDDSVLVPNVEDGLTALDNDEGSEWLLDSGVPFIPFRNFGELQGEGPQPRSSMSVCSLHT